MRELTNDYPGCGIEDEEPHEAQTVVALVESGIRPRRKEQSPVRGRYRTHCRIIDDE